MHLLLEVLGPGVIVKRKDVGFAKLNLLQFIEIGLVERHVCCPDSTGEWLGRIHRVRHWNTCGKRVATRRFYP